MKLYREILVPAWQRAIKSPRVWVFGFFATFILGNGGEIDRYLHYWDTLTNQTSFANPVSWQHQWWFKQLLQLPSPLYVCAVVVVVVLIALFIFYIMMTAEGALITAAQQTKVASFSSLFQSGQKSALSLGMLNAVVYGLLTVALAGSSLVVAQQHLSWISLAVVSVVLIVLILGTSLVTKYTANYIVLAKQPLGRAVMNGWKLVRNNLKVSLQLIVFMFGIGLVLNLGIIIAILIVLMPYVAAVLATTTILQGNFVLTGALTVVLYGFASISIGTIFSTWQWTAWTLLFKKLTVAN